MKHTFVPCPLLAQQILYALSRRMLLVMSCSQKFGVPDNRLLGVEVSNENVHSGS